MLISVLAVLALLATLVGVLFHQVQSEATIAIDRLQPAAGAAARVAVGNEAMERGVLAYTITTDPRRPWTLSSSDAPSRSRH